MTQTDTTTTSTSSRFRLPLWLAIPVLALIVAASAFFVYKYLWKRDNTQSGDAVVLSDEGIRAAGRGPRFARQTEPSAAAAWGLGEYPEGVSKYPRGTIIARRGPAYLRYDPAAKSLRVDYLSSTRRQWITRQQWDLHDIAYRVTETRALAEHMKATEAQKEKLRALTYNLPITSAEQSTLVTQIQAWDKAAGAARDTAGATLLMTLYQVATAHLEPTKSAMVRRVEQIPTILSPEQIQLGQTYFTSTPSPQPAKP
jgi:hypothetical protein